MAMPPLKEDPDVEIKDTPEENYIDDDRVMDWDAVSCLSIKHFAVLLEGAPSSKFLKK